MIKKQIKNLLIMVLIMFLISACKTCKCPAYSISDPVFLKEILPLSYFTYSVNTFTFKISL